MEPITVPGIDKGSHIMSIEYIYKFLYIPRIAISCDYSRREEQIPLAPSPSSLGSN
ncbi:hypothetical protein LEMLEM_LOCUS4024 [Lemmus lemmus]